MVPNFYTKYIVLFFEISLIGRNGNFADTGMYLSELILLAELILHNTLEGRKFSPIYHVRLSLLFYRGLVISFEK